MFEARKVAGSARNKQSKTVERGLFFPVFFLCFLSLLCFPSPDPSFCLCACGCGTCQSPTHQLPLHNPDLHLPSVPDCFLSHPVTLQRYSSILSSAICFLCHGLFAWLTDTSAVSLPSNQLNCLHLLTCDTCFPSSNRVRSLHSGSICSISSSPTSLL